MPERGGPDQARDARVANQNRERTKGLDARDNASAEEARMKAQSEQGSRQQALREREKFSRITEAPKMEAASKKAHELALPASSVDSSKRTEAPTAYSGTMEKTVDDSNDWVNKARDSVRDAPKPVTTPKKRFFGLFG